MEALRPPVGGTSPEHENNATPATTPLEDAVCILLGDRRALYSSDLQTRAEKFCNEFTSDPDSWRLAVQQFLHRSTNWPPELPPAELNGWLLHPRFLYARTVADAIRRVSPADRQLIRAALLSYVQQTLPLRARHAASTPGTLEQVHFAAPPSPDDPLILRQVALWWVRLLERDYADGLWTGAVTDLLDLLASLQHVRPSATAASDCQAALAAWSLRLAVLHLFLTICETVHDDIVADDVGRTAEERALATRIKDQLREGDILRLAEHWLAILEELGEYDLSARTIDEGGGSNKAQVDCSRSHDTSHDTSHDSSNNGSRNSRSLDDISSRSAGGLVGRSAVSSAGSASLVRGLLQKCLRLLGKYVLWVDVHVLVNERFMAAALRLFEPNLLGVAAIDFFQGIVTKRMDEPQRVMLVHKLDLVSLLRARCSASALSSPPSSAADSPLDYLRRPSPAPELYYLRLGAFLSMCGVQMAEAFAELAKRGFAAVQAALLDSSELRLRGGVAAAGLNPFFTAVDSEADWEALTRRAWRLTAELFELALVVWQFPHPALAETVLPFWAALLRLCRRGEQQLPCLPPDELRDLLRRLLQTSAARLQCPCWFDFAAAAAADEPQELFAAHREELLSLLQRLAALAPDLAQQLWLELFARFQTLGSAASVQEKELIMRLLLAVGGDADKEAAGGRVASASMVRLFLEHAVAAASDRLADEDRRLVVLLLQILKRFLPELTRGAAAAPVSGIVLQLILPLLSAADQDPAVVKSCIDCLHRSTRGWPAAVLEALGAPLSSWLASAPLPTALLRVERYAGWPAGAEVPACPPQGQPWSYDDQQRFFEFAAHFALAYRPADYEALLNSLLAPLQDHLAATQEQQLLSSSQQQVLSSSQQQQQQHQLSSSQQLLSSSQSQQMTDFATIDWLVRLCANLGVVVRQAAQQLPEAIRLRVLEVAVGLAKRYGAETRVRGAATQLWRKTTTRSAAEPVDEFVLAVVRGVTCAFARTLGKGSTVLAAAECGPSPLHPLRSVKELSEVCTLVATARPRAALRPWLEAMLLCAASLPTGPGEEQRERAELMREIASTLDTLICSGPRNNNNNGNNNNNCLEDSLWLEDALVALMGGALEARKAGCTAAAVAIATAACHAFQQVVSPASPRRDEFIALATRGLIAQLSLSDPQHLKCLEGFGHFVRAAGPGGETPEAFALAQALSSSTSTAAVAVGDTTRRWHQQFFPC